MLLAVLQTDRWYALRREIQSIDFVRRPNKIGRSQTFILSFDFD
jgi:hypothetical protein